MGYQFTRERANSVKEVLVSHGVDESRLVVRGYSNTRPLVWQLGDAAGAANRRVEVYVNINGLEVPPRRDQQEYAREPPTSTDRARFIITTFVGGDDDDDEDDDEDDEDLEEAEDDDDDTDLRPLLAHATRADVARLLLPTGRLQTHLVFNQDEEDDVAQQREPATDEANTP